MKLKNILIIFLVFLFNLGTIYSASATYIDQNSNQEFYIDFWNTLGFAPGYHLEKIDNSYIIKKQSSSSHSATINYNSASSIKYAQVFVYPKNTEDYILKHQALDLNQDVNRNPIRFTWNGYRPISDGDLASVSGSNKCDISSISFNENSQKLRIDSNLQTLKLYDIDPPEYTFHVNTIDYSSSDIDYFDNLLEKYHYMKAHVSATLSDSSGTSFNTIYADNSISTSSIKNLNGNDYLNYNLIKPLSYEEDFTIKSSDDTQYYFNHGSGYGTYTWTFRVTPIDLKCDFDFSRNLESDEIDSATTTYSLTVNPPSTPTINGPSDNSVISGNSFTLDTTVNDIDGNDLTVYILVDNSVYSTHSSVKSGSDITQRVTGLSEGSHTFKVLASDGFSNVSSQTRTITFENDPTFSNVNVNPSSPNQYNENTQYTFSIDLFDDSSIKDVTFTLDGTDYSGSNINKNGNTYSISLRNLTTGTYSYLWTFEDSFGNSQTSPSYSYIITKADSSVDLTLNGNSNNIEVEIGELINISSSVNPLNGLLRIFENGSEIGNGIGTASIIRSYNYIVSNLEINSIFSGNSLFKGSNEKLYISTVDTTAPEISNIFPSSGSLFVTEDKVNISAKVIDNLQVQSVIAQITLPNGVKQNISLNKGLNDIFDGTFTIPNQIGTYSFRIIARDDYSNIKKSNSLVFQVSDNDTPEVVINAPKGNSFSTSEQIMINTTVKDNIEVTSVVSQITLPNGIVQNISLIKTSNDIYLGNFSIPNQIGTYSFKIIARDTSSNVNNSETSVFNVLDTSNPRVSIIKPAINSEFNIQDLVNINISAEDNIALDSVFGLINLPNGSVKQIDFLKIENSYLSDYAIPNLIGTYNLTIIANDTSSNVNNSEMSSFTIKDNILPSVTFNNPLNNTNFTVNEVLLFNATVTDSILVDTVKVKITLPNGTIQNVLLNEQSNNIYTLNYLIPNKIGTYYVQINANDTSSNMNYSEIREINVFDTSNPKVMINTPNKDNFSIQETVLINTTIIDLVEVNSANAQITLPNGIVQNISLIKQDNTDLYFGNFTTPNIVGRYNITIIANDTSSNMNNTETTFFNALDKINPKVQIVRPSSNSNFSIQETVVVNVTATDSIGIDSIKGEMKLPNGTIQDISFMLQLGDSYLTNFVVPDLIGTFDLSIIVNDTSGNINNSQTISFTSKDEINPQVIINTPNELNITTLNTVLINTTIIDSIGVDSADAQITLPNGTIQNISLTKQDNTNLYFGNFTAPNLIGSYSALIFTNDTSSNVNNTESILFNVKDESAPNVILNSPIRNSNFGISETILLNISATDNILVDSAIAIISYPNNQNTTINLNKESNQNSFTSNFTIPNIIGTFNVTFIVNDTSGNVNNLQIINFTTKDNLNPEVKINTPLQSSYNTGSLININITATDVIELNSVLAYVNLPNGNNETIALNNISSNFLGNFTVPNQIGNYTLFVIATDTSSNVNKTNFSFKGIDSIQPSLTITSPSNLQQFNLSDTIILNSSVNDNVEIDTVQVEVNLSNGSSEIILLNKINNTMYQNSYKLPDSLIGLFNLSYFVNDTSGNSYISPIKIEVVDTINPKVSEISSINGNSYEYNSEIEMKMNITESVQVDTSLVVIQLPNNTTITLPLVNTNNNETIYSINYTIPKIIGTYNATFIVNDSSGNVNNSESISFNSVDTTKPEILITSPINNSRYNVSELVIINASFKDDIGTDSLIGKITLPNGTLEIINFTLLNETYISNYTIPNQIGTYNVTFVGNDTSSNVNNKSIQFIGVDNMKPVIHSLSLDNITIPMLGDISIIVNSSDNVEISTVKGNIQLPNNTTENLSFVNSNMNIYNTTYSVSNLTGQYNISYAITDSSGNEIVQNSTFRVVKPRIIDSSISKKVIENGTSLNFFIQAEYVDSLIGIVTLPNGTIQNISLNNGLDTAFTNTSQVGTYFVEFIVSDSNENKDKVNSSFESFTTLPINLTIQALNNSNMNTTVNFIYNNSIVESLNGSLGNLSMNLLDTVLEIQASSFNDTLSVRLKDILINNNSNRSLILDKTTNHSIYSVLYGVQNSFNFSNATVILRYEDSNTTNESRLRVFKCDNYNITDKTCSSTFYDITSQTIQDNISNTFSFTVNSFSGFGIREVEPVVTPTPSSGSSSGGGGGGGRSSKKSSSSSINKVIENSVSSVKNQTTCTVDWACTDWELSCPANGIQTRTCSNIGTCSGSKGKPETTRTCSTYKQPEKNNSIDVIQSTEHVITGYNESLTVNMNLSSLNISEGQDVKIIYRIISSDKNVIEEFTFSNISHVESWKNSLDTSSIPTGNYTLETQILVDDTRYLSETEFEINTKNEVITLNSISGNIIAEVASVAIAIIVLVLIVGTLLYFEIV